MTHSGILIPPSNNTGCYPCNSSEVYLNVSGLQTAGKMYSFVIIANVTGVTSDPMTVSYATGNFYFKFYYVSYFSIISTLCQHFSHFVKFSSALFIKNDVMKISSALALLNLVD